MKWQYRTVAFPIARGFFPFKAGGQVEQDEITRALNELGGEGWELVSAFDTNYEGGSTNTVVCILKRPASA
jgi:hypothetical protein